VSNFRGAVHSQGQLVTVNPANGSTNFLAAGSFSNLDSVLVDNDLNGTWDDTLIVYGFTPTGETRRTTGWISQNGTIPSGYIPLPSSATNPYFYRFPQAVGVNGRFVLNVIACQGGPYCPLELRIAGVGNNSGYPEQFFPHIPLVGGIDLVSSVQIQMWQTQLAPTATPMPPIQTANFIGTLTAAAQQTATASSITNNCDGDAFRTSTRRDNTNITGLDAHEGAGKIYGASNPSGDRGHTISEHVLSSSLTSDDLRNSVTASNRRASAFSSEAVAEEWISRLLDYVYEHLDNDMCSWLNDAQTQIGDCREFSVNYTQLGYTPPSPIGVGWIWDANSGMPGLNPAIIRGVKAYLTSNVK
jgi:hypothetical protein